MRITIFHLGGQMRVDDLRNANRYPTRMPCTKIPPGTVFSGEVGDLYGASVYLRGGGDSAAVIVDLQTPTHHWTTLHNLTVFDYQPVEAHVVIERDVR